MTAALSLFELTERHPDEASAIAHFEELRWGAKLKGAHCPDCGSVDVLRTKANRRLPLWVCHDCKYQFTVTSGTIMDHTMLPLRKWLFAFHIIGGSKKGVSARYLARTLSITPKTAWHLGHRIRSAMTENDQKFSGIVETDETYIGGKRKHVGKGYRKNKIAVQTIIKRNTQRTASQAQTIALDPQAEDVDGRTLGAKLRMHTNPSKTVLMTDQLAAYRAPGAKFKDHRSVNHKKEEYVREDPDGLLVHTNSAEGFFGNLKRQIHGTHHHVSKKHLPRYLEEFDYKFNTREMDDGARTTAAMMRISTAKRVTLYKSKSGGDSLFDRGRPTDGAGKRKRKAKRKAGRQSRAHARKRGPRYGPVDAK